MSMHRHISILLWECIKDQVRSCRLWMRWITSRGWCRTTSGTREKWGCLADENRKWAKTRRVPDVHRFWHRNKARGSDVDRFWVFPPRKKPCDGSCTGRGSALGPNQLVGVKKVGQVGRLPDVNRCHCEIILRITQNSCHFVVYQTWTGRNTVGYFETQCLN